MIECENTESSWTDALYKKYPKLFRQKDLPASETCMCWGICCGEGWKNIIENACEKLQKLADETNSIIEFAQVKEKFGGLRLYLDIDHKKDCVVDVILTNGVTKFTEIPTEDVWEKAHVITTEAENMSLKTCDVCGEPGFPRSGGWIVTRCDNHIK